jgi:uncharacterized membrane protein YphA (DoxX/SURF4 family)
MNFVLVAVQVFIAIAMFDVWLLRYNRPLRARGGNSQTMPEEFEVYGLPVWLLHLVRVLKLSSGALMIVGVWYSSAAFVAGVALVVLMASAIAMHIKIQDPVYKAMPATLFFLLSCYVAYANRAALLG